MLNFEVFSSSKITYQNFGQKNGLGYNLRCCSCGNDVGYISGYEVYQILSRISKSKHCNKIQDKYEYNFLI